MAIAIYSYCMEGRCGMQPLCADTEEIDSKKAISDYDFPGLKNKISLDLRGMDMIDILKFLAVEGNLNIVAGKDVAGSVSLLINDVTIGDALDIVLSINNLAYQVKGNIIKITPNTEYKALHGADFYDQRQTVIYQLKFASAKNLGAMLGNVKSEIGKIIFDDSTGTVVLIDTPEKIKEMDGVIKKQELPTVTRVLPTETRIFELKYASADSVKEEITKALSPEIGSMRVDKRTNTLVITDLPHQMNKIEAIVKAFDRKTREVFIEAKVIQVTLSDTFKWGIDWSKLVTNGYKSQGLARKLFITPEVNMPLNLTGTFSKVTLNSVGSSDLSAVLELLSTVGETKILSNPHITIEEGKEATIKVITRQPYKQETTTTTTASTTTSVQYVFVDVGVMLYVTPTINQDGYISMLIKPEVSSITDWYPSSTDTSRVPVVETANAETTVTVKDNVTIILSGMIKDAKTKSVNKVPILGDIPLIRYAFRNVSDVLQRTETMVFLTPRIVTGDKSYMLMKDMEKPIKDIRQ